ncbi:hypothetical protein BI380_09465 [Delftia tsuruhatensis]|uniref:Uncharacterized protein n=2 Tax=Delftia tsuruhatensis TaxID=180282 RepID=A0ABM6E2G6_9BURK|nr:hypothetical protein BI380_09465 [Delftia tsuruhatensis]
MTGRPYTHAEHAARCRAAAQVGHTLQSQHVQIMRRGVLYCAQICNAWTTPDGQDLWTVETSFPEAARFTVPCRQVRLCEPCSCAAEGTGAEGAPLAGEGPRRGPEGVTCL